MPDLSAGYTEKILPQQKKQGFPPAVWEKQKPKIFITFLLNSSQNHSIILLASLQETGELSKSLIVKKISKRAATWLFGQFAQTKILICVRNNDCEKGGESEWM